ncbi:uncharacterized protein BT62DRAFT_692920 [Guyanagaster necrorhizus]|uniref:Uncharacterized protein n=1 Tax=Guyanagaster necrorhizus TaxID=856835 RepID=A0A9P7VGT1_9AGAR|nr:uncharacterized protein BT62DRAFT_692920 [Guyanagaster necrorhizus MCA 3950]KAG7439709.1 hypothetical protein BT62DRAFT_692920 [Guyanagaster necrorhizus MCA 3950]
MEVHHGMFLVQLGPRKGRTVGSFPHTLRFRFTSEDPTFRNRSRSVQTSKGEARQAWRYAYLRTDVTQRKGAVICAYPSPSCRCLLASSYTRSRAESLFQPSDIQEECLVIVFKDWHNCGISIRMSTRSEVMVSSCENARRKRGYAAFLCLWCLPSEHLAILYNQSVN